MTDYTKLVEALRILQDKNSLSYYKRQVCNDASAAIEALQAQLPKRGEWIVKGANRIDCSVCGHSVRFAFGLSDGSFDLYKYCPECGAKMEVQDEIVF